MKMNRTMTFARGAALAVLAIGLAGCGKAEEALNNASVAISGTLSGASLASYQEPFADLASLGIFQDRSMLMSITDYSVRCVTLSGAPEAGEGSCDATGKFSLSIANATNVPIGCFILKSNSIIATVAFQSSSTGIDGSAVREGSYVAGDGATGLEFGTVTLDLSTGQATVNKSSVAQTGGSAPTTASGTWHDMTGNWVISAAPSTPTGYATVCPAGTTNCQGPVEGEGIHIRQYHVVENGTTNHYGLSIWESAAAFGSCGSAEGVTLPSGSWVAQDTANTTAAQLTGAMSGFHTTFLNPAAVSPQGGEFCGQTGLSTCNDISSAGWGLDTADECKFYCAIHGLWNRDSLSGCGSEFYVDWSTFHSQLKSSTVTWNSGTSTWDNITPTTSGNTVSYLGGSVKFEKKPRNRHMSNEVSISGSVGTLVDSHGWTFKACTAFDANNNCTGTQVDCNVTENLRLTFTQKSATEAYAELVMLTTLAAGADTACSSNPDVSNRLGTRNMYFKVTKQ